MNEENELRFLADESSRPYEDYENPFGRTQWDDDLEKMIINKYNLTPKPDQI
jgi:hypothetical protein